ncbi:MAG: V-type ATP synthase subunit D [Gammaproteobacteria bacterium]|nr:V-type ATP synthase subunit D [Gammaproteobacteria bacterium]MDH5800686.1 V-type ATP synthase subunit D [Gammaproteobacteria bacterium]
MPQRDRAATLSEVMELRREQQVVLEAYDFLDEKRLLLAAELLRQMKHYEQLRQHYDISREQAELALLQCVKRHGLQGTEVYPADYLEDARVELDRLPFIGITLTQTRLLLSQRDYQKAQNHLSPEAEHCTEVFTRLVHQACVLAGVSGNLYRLMQEYSRTERRARALENVIIPEMKQGLRELLGALEEQEQEEIVRAHFYRN